MQHAVGFVHPTRLLGHQVKQVTPRLCRRLLSDRLPTNRIESSCGIGIDQRRRIVHLHLCCYRRDAQRHYHVHGNLGADFHQVAPGSKSFGMQTQTVNSKGKILRNVLPVRPGHKRPPYTVGLTHQFSGGRNRRSLGIMGLDA